MKQSIPNHLTIIYHIRHRNGLTKIGRSKNPTAREQTLQSEDPELKLIWKSDPTFPRMEKWWHKRFKEKRVRGEWFDVTDSELEKAKLIFAEIAQVSKGDLKKRKKKRKGSKDHCREFMSVFETDKSPFLYAYIHIGYNNDGTRKYSPRSTKVMIDPDNVNKHGVRRDMKAARRVAMRMQKYAYELMKDRQESISVITFERMVEGLCAAFGKDIDAKI